MWESLAELVFTLQRSINQSVAGNIGAYSQSQDWLSLLAVLPVGVAFGAVHALTPGHSKTVLASYLAGSPFSVFRGIGIATVLSLTHISSAVLIAVLALPVISITLGSIGRAPLLEDVSRALLALVGVWMIARAWLPRPHRHPEGPWVGVMAGLIPCPLTLFAMVMATSRGVPEAGIAFAVAMMLGVAFTLSSVAALTILARDGFERLLERRGASLQRTARLLEGVAGCILLLIGLHEVLLR